MLIAHGFADDVTDLGSNFGEAVLFLSVERVHSSLVLLRGEQDFRYHPGLILSRDRRMLSSSEEQP